MCKSVAVCEGRSTRVLSVRLCLLVKVWLLSAKCGSVCVVGETVQDCIP